MAFFGLTPSPGSVRRERVPVGEFADGSPIALPVVIARGQKDGPTLYIQAGQHGDELTGIEICRTFAASLDPRALSGTVVAIPVVNVPAHVSRTRGFLHEERWLIDMNRIWPGNPRGLLTERIADLLFTECVGHADLTVDMHSGLEGCEIIFFSSLDPDDDAKGSRALRERVACAMGTPYVFYKPKGKQLTTSDMSRSIADQADRAGRPLVSLEGGESRRVTWRHVQKGVRALHNAMRVLGMEAGDPVTETPPRRFSDLRLVHTDHGGGLRLTVDLGDEVKEGDLLGEVVDVYGGTVEQLRSPAEGFVCRVMRLGVVNTGAEAVWIAR